MSNTTVNAYLSSTAPPQGLGHALVWPEWLLRFGRAILREAEAYGHAHARSELRRLAVIHAHCPELARQLREAAERPMPTGRANER